MLIAIIDYASPVDELRKFGPAVVIAILFWVIFFGQEVFGGRVTIRKLLTLTAFIAVAVLMAA